jgi:hypothetical protein
MVSVGPEGTAPVPSFLALFKCSATSTSLLSVNVRLAHRLMLATGAPLRDGPCAAYDEAAEGQNHGHRVHTV